MKARAEGVFAFGSERLCGEKRAIGLENREGQGQNIGCVRPDKRIMIALFAE